MGIGRKELDLLAGQVYELRRFTKMMCFNSFGYSGDSCLPRMICEIASNPLTNNGVIGDVLQILFT